MAAFEHVMGLMSFVLALALAHLLSSVIEIVRAGTRVKPSWIHAGWMLFGLMQTVAWWVGMWDAHIVSHWTTPAIWLNLACTLSCYLFVGLVCPRIPAEGPVDLAAFNLGHRRQYLAAAFGMLLLGICLAFFYQYVLHVPDQLIQAALAVAMIAGIIPAFLSTKASAQGFSVIVGNVGWILFFLVGDPALT
jgi:hypothetical protein